MWKVNAFQRNGCNLFAEPAGALCLRLEVGSNVYKMNKELKLKAGEWVEVRSKEEILKTLDKNGRLDGMPFMPEMFAYCGQRVHVFKRAHKTCDTATGAATGIYEGRRLKNAVHLDGIRCDGQFHGGCEAGCLIFWKEAWLRRTSAGSVDSKVEPPRKESQGGQAGMSTSCTDADVLSGTQRESSRETEDGPLYVCQATQVPAATEPLSSTDWRQYLEDYTSGNVGLGRMMSAFIYMGYRFLIRRGSFLRPALVWFYDAFQTLFGGVPYPRRVGDIPIGGQTPTAKLDLRPGEWVRVKSYKAILATCDGKLKNRGLVFDAEMVPFCGRTYRVLKSVTKIVDEATGKMVDMKNPCIILEGVVCEARYSECRLFCPRSIYAYWREIWLERVSQDELSGLKADKRAGSA